MFYFSGTDVEVAGASPETLVKLENGVLHTFPLAGTRPRGRTEAEDKALEAELLADEKELCAYLANAEFAYTASGHERYITAQNKAQKGAILLGYDDRVSIDYFGKYCKGYYLENHTIYDALETVWHDRASIENELSAFENKLFCDFSCLFQLFNVSLHHKLIIKSQRYGK